MTLHIISQNCPKTLENCMATLASSDAIIFINDGVYALVSHQKQLGNVSTFALEHDMKARGIETNNTINYAQFVALSCQHNPIQSWY